jgi:hypothetical protein
MGRVSIRDLRRSTKTQTLLQQSFAARVAMLPTPKRLASGRELCVMRVGARGPIGG